jgi:alpha,alpha-trehalose-phosphate synthase [UDP-forming]
MDPFGWLRRAGLIVLSNREPFVHQREPDGAVRLHVPAGGVTSALQPVMSAAGGTWVAWGSGTADFDVTDRDDSIAVPPEQPTFRLRRLRLSAREIEGYYLQLANRALWPLCHSQLTRLVFDADDWAVFKEVNRRFAQAVVREAAGRSSVVWIHDYHLAMVPGLLRRVRGLLIHHFWHIPWPPPDILRTFPKARTLVRSLLGNHLLAFQTPRDVRNFLASARRFIGPAVIDARRGLVRVGSQETRVRAFPISIDVECFARLAQSREIEELARRLRREVVPHGGHLLLGVDRIDYTKGIPRRFDALARLLTDHPDLRGRVTLYQVGVPTRLEVPEFATFEGEVVEQAAALNRDFGRADWQPIHLVRENLDQRRLTACYRAADVCLVTPLQDGMNLVAKEFVACQAGRLGVLVLSRFAGSAREMRGSLLVNPYDVGATARAMAEAIAMAPEERERRLRQMRQRLEANTLYDWVAAIFKEVTRLRRQA